MADGNVIELPYKGPMLSGQVTCLVCRHVWVAVSRAGTVAQECPECHAFAGMHRLPIYPREGAVIWECRACKNDLFYVQSDRISCCRCGQEDRLPLQ